MRATSRALRPRSDASFLNVIDLLEDEDRDDDFVVGELEDRARIVEQDVGVEDEMFHANAITWPSTLDLLGFAARDRHLLDDDVGHRLVARAALRRR